MLCTFYLKKPLRLKCTLRYLAPPVKPDHIKFGRALPLTPWAGDPMLTATGIPMDDGELSEGTAEFITRKTTNEEIKEG